jgi:tetratricopeptide (TPR) repeat protein
MRATLAGVVVAGLGVAELGASEADLLIPGEFESPVPLELSERAEQKAEAQARYITAIFEEETEGPDKALENKHRVLFLDPAFCSLAIDVAQHHLRRGEVAEALAVLKDAAKGSPREASPSLALASIYLRHLQKSALAEKYALAAQEVEPNNPVAHELLWEIYRSTGQTRKIEALFQKAAASESQDPDYWLAIVDIRLRDATRSRQGASAGTLKKVTELLERATKWIGDDPELLSRAADDYAACGEPERATELYRQAFEKNPAIDGLRDKLADSLVALGQDDEAAVLLEQSLAEDPINLTAYDHLARVRLRQKDLTRAISCMRQAILLAPIDPQRYEDLIRVAFWARDTETALQTATDAEKKFPYHAGFTLFRAIGLSQTRQHAAALMAFERTLIEASNSTPELLDSAFFMSYGIAAEQAGHYVKAAELLEKSIALAPEKSAEVRNYLAYMWAERGENLDEAEALIRHALESDSENGAYIDTLGWVFFRRGQYADALAEFLRAASLLESPDPVIFEHIGDTYEKLGKTAEAVLYWRKANQLAPSNAVIAEKIDRYAASLAGQSEKAAPVQ